MDGMMWDYGNGWSGISNMMAGGFLGLGIAAALIILINFIAVLWALADIMRERKMDAGIRISWVLIIITFQIIGALLYLFVGKERE